MKKFQKPIFVTRPLFPPLKDYTKKLQEIWDAQWLSNKGKQFLNLEKDLSDYFGTKNISIFNNGTIALMSVLKMLDLKGEVITTPFTFAATPHCLTWNNLTPVFCDIKQDTMCIDADKVESLITPKTTAILAVHVFGNPCDVEKLEKIAKKHKLKLIFDGAHAFGIKIKERDISSYGDATMYSFHPTKLFHSGEGGAVITKTMDLKEKLDLWKNFGIPVENEILLPGLNGKMNELQAAMGILVLKEVAAERKKREKIQKAYLDNLSIINGLSIYMPDKSVIQSLQYFVIRINEKDFGKSRDTVYEELMKYNVFARKYFFPLCSNYPYYKDLPSSNPKKLPIANQVVSETLSLPFYGGLDIADAILICKIIKYIQEKKNT
jgi:dTDP-4-amino-4,6-dideoxygalactose transaminase